MKTVEQFDAWLKAEYEKRGTLPLKREALREGFSCVFKQGYSISKSAEKQGISSYFQLAAERKDRRILFIKQFYAKEKRLPTLKELTEKGLQTRKAISKIAEEEGIIIEKPKTVEELGEFVTSFIKNKGYMPSRKEVLDAGFRSGIFTKCKLSQFGIAPRKATERQLKVFESMQGIEILRCYSGYKIPIGASEEQLAEQLRKFQEDTGLPVRVTDLTSGAYDILRRRVSMNFDDFSSKYGIRNARKEQYSIALIDILEKEIGRSLIREARFDWSVSLSTKHNFYRYDARIKDTNILIEIDGASHFSSSMDPVLKTKLEDRIKRDNYKNRIAAENGFILLRFKIKTNIYDIAAAIKKVLSFTKEQNSAAVYLYAVANILRQFPSDVKYDETVKRLSLPFPSSRALKTKVKFSEISIYENRRERAIERMLTKAKEYYKQNGRFQTKDDFNEAPSTIKSLFGSYTALKEKVLEELEQEK